MLFTWPLSNQEYSHNNGGERGKDTSNKTGEVSSHCIRCPFPSWMNKARLRPSLPPSLPHLACFSGRNSRVAARFSDVFGVFLRKERRPDLSRGAIWLEDQSGTRRERGQLSSTPLERRCFLVFDYTRLKTDRNYMKIRTHLRDKVLIAERWSTNFCIN